MDTVIKILFAEGNNDGDITVMCKDGDFTCHSFVIRYTCPTLKTMYEHSLTEKKTADQDNVLWADEYSTKVMKYLFSILYDQTLGEKKGFHNLLITQKENIEINPVTKKETKTVQTFLSVDSLTQYVKAKDYFGIEYGCDEIPYVDMYFALNIIKNLPNQTIYEPLKKQLYDNLSKTMETLDFDDKRISFLFDAPEMCKKVMEMYKAKLNKIRNKY